MGKSEVRPRRNEMDQWEREERYLEEQYERGEISSQEFTRQMNDLWRDYRGAAQESAERAYDEEMNRW